MVYFIDFMALWRVIFPNAFALVDMRFEVDPNGSLWYTHSAH